MTTKRVPPLVVHAFTHYSDHFGRDDFIDLDEKTSDMLQSDLSYIQAHPELDEQAMFWTVDDDDDMFMDIDTLTSLTQEYKDFEIDKALKALPKAYHVVRAANLFLTECNFEGFYTAMYNYCVLRDGLDDFADAMNVLGAIGYDHAKDMLVKSETKAFEVLSKNPEYMLDGMDDKEAEQRYQKFCTEVDNLFGSTIVDDVCDKIDSGALFELFVTYIKTDTDKFLIEP